jgi:P4 family phage/plasmid primase-like protien
MNSTNLKALAEQYYEQGLPVLPVGGDKRPLLGTGWHSLYEGQVFETQYQRAWAKAQGIGLYLGKPSGVICLDIDILESDEALAEVRRELLSLLPPVFCGRNGNPEKPTARFYRYSGETGEKFNQISVELLSTGNQVLIPPSYHAGAQVHYEWVGTSLLHVDADDLPYLDESILVWLREENSKRKKKTKVSDLLRQHPGRCASGSHNHLSKLGVALRYKGDSRQEMIKKLLNEDRRINALSDYLYFECPSRPWPKGSTAEQNALEFVAEIESRHEIGSSEGFEDDKARGFFIEVDTKSGVKQVPDYTRFSEFCKRELYLKCNDGLNYIYNGSYYKMIDRLGLDNLVYEHTLKKVGPTQIGNFVKMMRANCFFPDMFMNPTNKLNMRNGILDTDTLVLSPHDPDVFFTYRINHDYTAGGETPVFDALLDLVATKCETKKRIFCEFIGYILSGCDYSTFNKVLILDGGGSNGKSTLINVIKGLVGMENISSETLESLKNNRFAVSSLVGKLVNFCAEEPKSAFSASGMLKKLTGNDPVQAEYKNVKAFSYVNYAKFIISYNEMPFLPDTTSGMQRRLIIVPCVTDLEANPELKIANVLNQVRPEYGAIIYKCLKAFSEVKERGAFTELAASDDRYQELVRASDPIVDFLHSEIVFMDSLDHETKRKIQILNAGRDPFVSTTDIWAAFEEFMGPRHQFRRRGFETRFGNLLKKVHGVERYRDGSLRGFTGMMLAKDLGQ